MRSIEAGLLNAEAHRAPASPPAREGAHPERRNWDVPPMTGNPTMSLSPNSLHAIPLDERIS